MRRIGRDVNVSDVHDSSRTHRKDQPERSKTIAAACPISHQPAAQNENRVHLPRPMVAFAQEFIIDFLAFAEHLLWIAYR